MKRNKLSQIWASVLITAVYWMRNYPISIVASFLSPISIVVIIAFVSKGALVGVAVEGAYNLSFECRNFCIFAKSDHIPVAYSLPYLIHAT